MTLEFCKVDIISNQFEQAASLARSDHQFIDLSHVNFNNAFPALKKLYSMAWRKSLTQQVQSFCQSLIF